MSKRAVILAVAMAASALLVSVPSAQAEFRVGKNYRLDSDSRAFRGKDAVALAVNPNNANHVVEVNNEYLVPNCEGTASFDGGITWSTADELPVPAPENGQVWGPACSQIGDHLAESMYQTVAFGTGQNVYAAYAVRRRNVGNTGDESQSIVLGKSTDGGRNWNTATVAMRAGTGSSPYYELPTVSVQRGAGTNGADRVYVGAKETTTDGLGTATAGDVAVAVSNDGGATFPANPTIVENPASENATEPSQVAIAADGKAYIAWRTVGQTGFVKIARSDNNGTSWGAPVTVAGVNNEAASSADPPTPSPSSGSTFPRIATGPGNNVYIVYNQGPDLPTGNFAGQDHFIPPDSDVYFQRSLNSGATWSTPKLINDATPKPGHESPASPVEFGVVTQTRHPNIAVAPNGRIDIVWQDRRHWYRGCIHTHVICNEARLGDTYYSSSPNAGGTFTENRRISDRSHNNDIGYDYRFGTGWAFGPVLAHRGNSQMIVGWMDSRNGNFESDRQDIYLAQVNVNGPAAVPQEGLTRSTNPHTSVTLSHHAYPGGGESVLGAQFASRSATRVVIANESDYPSILAGGVLARAHLSQLLLSPAGGLTPSVKSELLRMRPLSVFLLGGTDKLSAGVEADLASAGLTGGNVQRISGASDAARAASIATALDRRSDALKTANTPAFNAVVVVNPASPDAAAAAGLAAARRLPFLFVDQNSIPAATSSAIAELDINKALVVGGTQWVSEAVRSQLPAGQRLGGADQYETSKAVVQESIARGLPTNLMYVANGASPIDGALLGSAVGRVTGLLALSKPAVGSTAAGTAGAMGLTSRLDRLILLGNVATPPRVYPLPGGTSATFPGCPTLTANVIRGTAASNQITGTTGADRIFAGTGNDRVDALAGNDCVDLGTGNDVGQGDPGNDLMVAGDGNDRMSGGAGRDRMRGNPGNDRLEGGRGNDRIFGDSGNDLLLGSFGNDTLHGVRGRDRISGSRGRDRINGGSSADVISGGSSADRIAGDQGNDRINGNSGADRISGNSGNDRITALDNTRDRINCGSGRDRVLADREDIVSRNCERVRRR